MARAAKSSHNGAIILLYHRVVPVLPADPWKIIDRSNIRVEVKRFEAQMNALARRFFIVPLQELLVRLAEGSLRPRQAAITFDDGYADNYLHALPVLRRMGIPATVFLTTSNVECGTYFWWDRLAWLIQQNVGQVLSVPSELGDEFDLRVPATARKSHYDLWRKLRAFEGRKRDQLLNPISPNPPQDDRPLTWQEAQEMGRHGTSFGGHSHSHPALVALSATAVSEEVAASRDLIRSRLDSHPVVFAYPFGLVDERVRRAVQAAGFLGAVTVQAGVCMRGTDSYFLPRITVPNCTGHALMRGLDRLHEASFVAEDGRALSMFFRDAELSKSALWLRRVLPARVRRRLRVQWRRPSRSQS